MRRLSHGSETAMVDDGAAAGGARILQALRGSGVQHPLPGYTMTLGG